MMNLLIASAAEKSALKWFLGALHPGIVHFPIGLLAAAAFFELIQLLRKRQVPHPATLPLIGLSALTSIPAVIFGFMLAEHGGNEGGTVELHKWLGIASAVAACVAAACAAKAKSDGGALMLLRVATMLGATLVMAAGYLGGEMTMNEGHLLKPLKALLGIAEAKTEDEKKPPVDPKPPTVDVKQPDSKEPLQTPAKISFEKEIAPIIKDMCFKCHGGEKVKGKFKLNTKTFAMDGGESGKAINPGKPEISKFYTSLVDGDEDIVMPPPKEKARPTKEQIEKVKLWILQGADWPDGFEFKK
jgi:uncharacterized membrane protein